MRFQDRKKLEPRSVPDSEVELPSRRSVSPGKQTQTASLPPRPARAPAPVQQKPAPAGQARRAASWIDTAMRPDLYPPPVQREDDAGQPAQDRGAQPAGEVHRLAAQGISGATTAYPHLDAIQRSFGGHDVSGIQAHVGGAATEATQAMGAEAYATGSHVAFRAPADLHTAAHEAAHVVQQRGGVQLQGGVGASGDGYERHADAVADLVVQGQSAESLLEPFAGSRTPATPVQMTPVQMAPVQMAEIHYAEDKILDTSKSIFQIKASIRGMAKEDLAHVIEELEKIEERDKGENSTLTFARDWFAKNHGDEESRREVEEQERLEQEARRIQDRKSRVRMTMSRMLGEQRGAPRTGVRPVTALPSETDPLQPDTDSPIVPKDLSARPTELHMAYKPTDPYGWTEIENVAEIGRLEGFKVEVLVYSEHLGELKKKIQSSSFADQIEIVVSKEPVSEWAEDSGEIMRNGMVGTPRGGVDYKQVESWSNEERQERGYDVPKDRPSHPAHRVGYSVAQDEKQREKQALAKSTGRGVRPHISHIEGGNLLTGTDAKGQTFALVGRDAVAVTRGILEEKVDKVEDSEVRAVIAEDLGLAPERVHFVEQPGQFHLDMGMVVFGNGLVFLNDSSMVYELIAKWAMEDQGLILGAMQQAPIPIVDKREREQGNVSEEEVREAFQSILAGLKQDLAISHELEQAALADLQKIENLTIVRVAGSFPGSEVCPLMNFLNGELGTSPDDRGYFITNGGTRRAESQIAFAYFSAMKRSAINTIYFVDPSTSEGSLGGGGGVGCRTKTAEE